MNEFVQRSLISDSGEAGGFRMMKRRKMSRRRKRRKRMGWVSQAGEEFA